MAANSEADNDDNGETHQEQSDYDEADGFVVGDDDPLEYATDEEEGDNVFTPPPSTQRRPARFVVESDEEDVEESVHFQEDEVASPRKPSPRKLASAPTTPLTPKRSRARIEAAYDSDDEPLVEIPKLGRATKQASPTKKPVVLLQSARASPSKPTRSVTRVEVLNITDSDEEVIAEKPKNNGGLKPPTSPKKTSIKPVAVVAPSSPKKTVPARAANSPAVKPATPRKKTAPKSKATVSDSDTDSRLIGGDTDYPNVGSKTVLSRNLKRPLTVTPPLSTRARSESRPMDSPSPSKKSKTREVQLKVEPSSPSLKPKGKQANPGIFAPRPPLNDNQTLGSTIWNALPYTKVTCEVHDEVLFDTSLEAIGAYDGLPKLRFCDIINAGSVFTGEPTGTIMWSVWAEFLPGANIDALRDLLLFVKSGKYVNLSRVNPTAISARAMASNRHEVVVEDSTAICISMGLVRNSYLVADMGNQYPTHGIRMVLHTYEYQRFGAVLGEIARRSHLATQVWDFAITFSTKTRPTVVYTEVEKKTKAAMSRFYKVYESPKKSNNFGPSTGSLKNHLGGLDYFDNIPVYDAREVPEGFKWTSAVFDNLPNHFDIYQGQELPLDSLVAVGYITQYYTVPSNNKEKEKERSTFSARSSNDDELRVGFLIRWILFFGAADPE